uniref:Uncharacterized protein n=1 Tax=Anguilla anguilla TaxID=7936 RepID=A0A0E9VVS6_ANGAN
MEAKTVEMSPFPSDDDRHARQIIVHQNQEIKSLLGLYFPQG